MGYLVEERIQSCSVIQFEKEPQSAGLTCRFELFVQTSNKSDQTNMLLIAPRGLHVEHHAWKPTLCEEANLKPRITDRDFVSASSLDPCHAVGGTSFFQTV